MVHRACKRSVREGRQAGKGWGGRSGDGGRRSEGRPARERSEGSGSRSEGNGSSEAEGGRRQAARNISMRNCNKVLQGGRNGSGSEGKGEGTEGRRQ